MFAASGELVNRCQPTTGNALFPSAVFARLLGFGWEHGILVDGGAVACPVLEGHVSFGASLPPRS